MKLVKLTQVVIKMPDMPPEVMQGMTQEELMDQQEIGEDQEVLLNPECVMAVYPNDHPKVEGGSIITIQAPPQMPPQIAVRQEVSEVEQLLQD
jgi:hypothetical protein|tara:strand:- start:7671 stop:7949 length:279 start_codon:yes stop_codon:yes gene_type:complete